MKILLMWYYYYYYKQLCVLVSKIRKKNTDYGRKELKKYLEKYFVDSLKKEGSTSE